MAKPRSPKKSIPVNENTQPATTSPENGAATAAAPALAPEPETMKAETRVKTDGRATIGPINLEDEIRRLAYLYSERRGFEAGHETEDWLAAEREVLQRYHQQTA